MSQPLYPQPYAEVSKDGSPMLAQTVSPWTVGPCDCLQDFGLCCDVLWCMPCMQGRIYSAASHDQPDTMNPLVCCGICVLQMWIPALGWLVNGVMNCTTRSTIERKYMIEENTCADCCLSFFCPLCTICQHHVELSKRGMNPGHTCCEPSRQFVAQPPPAAVQPGYSTGV
ncbi:hypothetical protein DIPPA_60507 [Diplonema papillatum]|nr:hypothetical protein DIPPA_60507 [Diplonema papillatum]